LAINHLGFKINLRNITNGVFIPKYYNPEIQQRLNELSATHDLIVFGDLVNDGHLSLSTGHEIGKMAYGTGNIPFVRTSDISNWEIKTNPKQGVSEEIYNEYAKRQDVMDGDIFFVKDGTYLIGQTCMVTQQDLPCLYQSHIIKIRVNPSCPIDKYLLFAILNTPIVKKQIRAKQFTADIIDTIGNRLLEIILPVPKNNSLNEYIIKETHSIIEGRNTLREKIRLIPLIAQGIIHSFDDVIPPELSLLEESSGTPGFKINLSKIQKGIFIPKYYDPKLKKDLKTLSETHNLIQLRDLVKQRIICWDTGIEIGKMAYGTGSIPFIRTSDISNWELKKDPKQNVSEEIYEANKQDVQPGDIFVVRDGTYLVGSSCIITEQDTKVLYCGGIYKLRVLNKDEIDPYLFLTLLHMPIVKRQIRSKQFTRDIIDTIGKRLFEVFLPIPKDDVLREFVAKETREAIEKRVNLRQRSKEIVLEVEGIDNHI
jgi:restriction endonuclease S subunit